MRVLAMFHAYVPFHGAGAEGMAHALLRHLVRSGHEVDVILSKVDRDAPQDYVYDGVSVHVHRGKTQTPSWIGNRRPDVIVCHLENTPRAAILGEMYGVPVVQLLHNNMPETLNSTQRYQFGMVVANTQWLARTYQDYWAENGVWKHRPRMLVVRPPVDPTEYAGKPGTHITLINMTVPKGAHLFYHLARELPQYKFLAVQGAYGIQVLDDGPSNVEVVPHVPSHDMVRDVYSRTKILLVPSDYESYGRVAAEALCSGIPVIAHPTPGLLEALGEAGIFHERDDISAWKADIVKLMNSARRYATASKAAREHAAQLDPTQELEDWRLAMEEVASVTAPAGHH